MSSRFSVEENTIFDLFSDKIPFYVPLYQRNYDWKKEEVETLFNDWNNFLKNWNDNKTYYLGTIVLKEENKNNERVRILVDGQQRVTTLILFYKAFLDIVLSKSEEGILNIDEKEKIELEGRIRSNIFFRKKIGDKNENLKLKLTNLNNQPFLESLLQYNGYLTNNLDKAKYKSTNFYKNFQFLKEKLNEVIIDENSLNKWMSIDKIVKFSTIYLGDEDEEHEIFENINSKGKELDVLDLVKNYFYTKLEKFSDQLSNELEKEINDFFDFKITNLDNKFKEKFVKHYIAYKTGILVKNDTKDIYKTFKEETSDNFKTFTGLNDFFNEFKLLILYYEYFNSFDDEYTKNNDEYSLLMCLLRKQNIDAYFPLLCHFADKYFSIENDECFVEDEDFKKVIKIIEKQELISKINKGTTERSNIRFFSSIPFKLKEDKNELNSTTLAIAFFKDKENWEQIFHSFENNLEGMEIYNLSKPITKHMLWRIDTSIEKNTSEFMSFEKYNEYSIEHILPQKITKEWKKQIPRKDLEKIINYLHRLSNLTLIVKKDNSKLSNKSFDDFKSKTYKDSHLSINKYFQNINSWNINELEKRWSYLRDRIKFLWSKFDGDENLSEEDVKQNYKNLWKNSDEIINTKFYMKSYNNDRDTYDATMRIEIINDNQRFIVEKGSKFSTKPTNSFKNSSSNKRWKEILKEYDDGILEKDEFFSSPSSAASFVYAGEKSGKTSWKTSNDLQLIDLLNGR